MNIFLEIHAFVTQQLLVFMMTFSSKWTQERLAVDVGNYVKSPISQLQFF